jgi:hypothetical protein
MKVANLTLQQTPPISVPFRFFLTAPVFGILASLLLLYDGTHLLSDRWSLETFAFTHLLTLGVISMVMMGAMLQLLPVLAGVLVPKPLWVSTILHLLLTVGTLGLTTGFLTGYAMLIHHATVLLGLSLFGFIGIVGYCLFRVNTNTPILTGMRLALTSLAVTIILGITLSSIFGHGFSIPQPQVLTNIHLTWGLGGWVALLVISVAYQVVPMFQITPPYSPVLTRWLVPVIFLSLLSWTSLYFLSNFYQWPNLLPQGLAGLLGVGLTLFAITTLYLQAHRLRKIPDVTLNYWRVGMAGLLLTIGGGLIGIIWPPVATHSFYDILLGILFIAGFILPVIQGMLYKIIPFLVWLHLQNRQLEMLKPLPLIKIPNMKQVISDKWARRQFWVYIVALGLLIGAGRWPLSGLMQLASMVLLCAFSLLGYNLYMALKLYWSVSRQLVANQT